MAELSDLQKKYGTGNLTPEQMIYLEQLRRKTGAETAQNIFRESSPELKPDLNVLQRTAEGARIAGDLVNKYAPKIYEKIPKRVTSLAPFGFVGTTPGFESLLGQSRKGVVNTEVPASVKFFPSVDTMTGEMQPAGFGDKRVKVGKVVEAIKPADLVGLTSAQKVYSSLGYGQAPEPLDVLDTLGLQAGMTQLGRAGLKGASRVARAGAPYVAEGLTDLVSKYGVDPRSRIVPEAPSTGDAIPEGLKMNQEGDKFVLYDASGKVYASGADAKSAIFRANKRMENEAANAARTARREARQAEEPKVEAKPEVKVDTDSEAPLFYNPLAKAAANLDDKYEFLPTEPTAADEILDQLKSYEGVTDDHILFSGIEDYVRARQSANLPVTKQDVMMYLDKHRIRLYEDYKQDTPGTSNLDPDDFLIGERDLDVEDPDSSHIDDLATNEEEWIRDNDYDSILESVTNRYPELDEERIQEKVDEIISDRARDYAYDMYYEDPYYTAERGGYTLSGNRNSGFYLRAPDGDRLRYSNGREYFNDLDEVNDAIQEHLRESGSLGEYNTKFSEREYPSYLMPGGRNYRELNIGLKEGSLDKSSGKREFLNQQLFDLETKLSSLLQENPIISERHPEVQSAIENLRERIQAKKDFYGDMEGVPFGWQGSHFDEPDLVAQLRLQDYDDVDGYSGTLMDEAQSDLHQKGRELGYRGTKREIAQADQVYLSEKEKLDYIIQSNPIVQKMYAYNADVYRDVVRGNFREILKNRIQKHNGALNSEIYRNNNDYANADRFPDTEKVKEAILADNARLENQKINVDFNDEATIAGLKEIEDQAKVLDQAEGARDRLKSSVPDAPFKKDWYHLAIRRAIKDAMDNGKDRLYIPKGEVISDRYNYAAAVDELAYKVKENGNYNVTITDFDGARYQSIGNQDFTNLEPNELDSIFGKAVADKMREKYGDKHTNQMEPSDVTYVINHRSLGDVIEAGGKGNKVWYNERYPNFAKKEAKEFDATFGETEIPTPVTNEKAKQKLIRSEARKRRISVRAMEEKIRYMDYDERQKFFADQKQPVFYIQFSDAMRQAYGKGRPYARGGLVTDALDAVDDHFMAMKEGGSVPKKDADSEAKNIEPVPILGQLAHLLNTGSEFLKSRPLKEEGDFKTRGAASAVNSALELVDQFFVNDLAKTADRAAYGFRVTSGKGETLKPLPETTGAALTLAPPAAKVARMAPKMVKPTLSLMDQAAKQGTETVFDMLERYAPKPMYVVPPADESKFLPLSIPRTRRSPQEIESEAERVARQMMGEHVRDPNKLKESKNLAGRSMKESERLKGVNYTLEQTKNLPVATVVTPKIGDVNVATVGDITVADRNLVDINGYPIESIQEGGPFFGQGKLHLPPDKSLWWASEPTSAKNYQNRVNEIAEHYGVDKLTAQHLAMGQQANNFAMHFADANLKAIATRGVPEEAVGAINKTVREGFSILQKGKRIQFSFPDFPGVENLDEAYKYFRANPEARKWFNARMKTPEFTQTYGLPNGLDIQWAITDPMLRNMEKNLVGRSVGEVYKGADITDIANHGTYGAGIRGRFKGTSEYPIPMKLSFSDAYDYTAARKRPQDVTGTMQKIAPHQVVDQQYLDEIGRYNELIKKYIGKSKGGSADDIPPLPPPGYLSEEDIVEWQRKSKAYEDRQYWKRRGRNSADEDASARRLDRTGESYPMRWKIPQERERQMMPEVRDEEIPFKRALRYYQKGGKVKGVKITEKYSIAPEARRPKLSKAEEEAFQRGVRGTKWFQQFRDKYGEPPNLNDSSYNYRAAWKAGVRPQDYAHDTEMQHWSSVTPSGESLKSKSHPTAWMEDYMQVTGRDPHDPAKMSPEQVKAMEKSLMYRYSTK